MQGSFFSPKKHLALNTGSVGSFDSGSPTGYNTFSSPRKTVKDSSTAIRVESFKSPIHARKHSQPLALFSPRHVVASARKEQNGSGFGSIQPRTLMNHTMVDLRSPKTRVAIPDKSMTMATKLNNPWIARDPPVDKSVTLQDMMDNVLNVPAFGFEHYNPRN